MRTRIEIDTRTFVRFWLVIFGIVLAAFLLYQARAGLAIIGVSAFLALALNGPVSLISKKLPSKSRVGATAIAYTAVILFLGAIIFLVIPPMVQQSAKVVQNIPNIVQTATTQWHVLSDIVDEYNLQSQLDTALESAKNTAQGWAGAVGKNVIAGIGSVFSAIAAIILVLVLTFLMLIEGPDWAKRVWRLYENEKVMKKHRHVVHRIYGVFNGYITGQLTVSSIGAVFAGLFVFVLSLIFKEIPADLAMPIAALSFTLSLIPMFGATIGGTIGALLLARSSLPAAIIYAIYFFVYQQIENNFISPHIQSKRIDLSALMVLGAVTIGLYMFGIVGGIIAIPIAGTIRVLVEEFLEHRRKPVKDEPSVKLAKAEQTSKS